MFEQTTQLVLSGWTVSHHSPVLHNGLIHLSHRGRLARGADENQNEISVAQTGPPRLLRPTHHPTKQFVEGDFLGVMNPSF